MASFANGDARAAYNTLELCVRSAKDESVENPGAKAAPGARQEDNGGIARGCAAAEDAAVRQGGRRTLQPDFGAAQVGEEFGPGRGAVLAGADD